MKKKAILLMLVLMFVSTNALSQSNTIFGHISGDIQEGINVNVSVVTCGAFPPYASLTTDYHGYYEIGGLPSGWYRVVPEDDDYTFAPEGSWVDIPQAEMHPYDFTSSLETAQSFMLPIAICEGVMMDDGCNIGRMFPDNDRTARWTDFTQENTGGCGTADIAQIGDLVADCSGNPTGLSGGQGVSTTNGTFASIVHDLQECFFGDYDNNTAQIMNVTLPVIDCEGSNNCRTVVGSVNIDIVWVKYGHDPQYNNAPEKIFDVNEDGEPGTDDDDVLYQRWPHEDFPLPDNATGQERWDSFIAPRDEGGFNLKDADGNPAVYDMPGGKTIYLKPSCE